MALGEIGSERSAFSYPAGTISPTRTRFSSSSSASIGVESPSVVASCAASFQAASEKRFRSGTARNRFQPRRPKNPRERSSLTLAFAHSGL